MAPPFYYQNLSQNTQLTASFKLLHQDFQNDQIPCEVDYYIARIMCNSNYPTLRSKFSDLSEPLVMLGTAMRDIYYIHWASFFALNESRISKCINDQELDQITSTDPCLVNFKLPDPIASRVGGFEWSNTGVRTDIIDLVGTGQLSTYNYT